MSDMSRNDLRISASLECADFLRLADAIEILKEAGIDMLHIDVMDGSFVPNFALGFRLIERVATCGIPLDIHLMITQPENHVSRLADVGAHAVSIHLETCVRPFHLLNRIKALGMKAGLALNPTTSLEPLHDLSEVLDRVVIMSVEPGFIGQKFIMSGIRRVGEAREIRTACRADFDVQVDGAVGWNQIPELFRAGATSIVAGTSTIFAAGTDLTLQATKLRAFCDALK